ncbi:MAG TPA: 4'-phosphopantetheinyl transferase superfamily protein [Micromonosporaceae bacterium]|nr:4'-phosphopantetheinyl transferase superfamily protein [Micromonosporaceae bacterium]
MGAQGEVGAETELVSGVCEVWWAAPGQQRPHHLSLLTGPERQRWERLRRDEDRARFIVATALLRIAVGRVLGTPPDRVVVERTCPTCGEPHGRPRLPGGELEVSVSHSGGQVAVALTTTAPVGVDVEEKRDLDAAALAAQILAPGERADGLDGFFTLWARKEAVVKATGDGLRVRMDQVAIDDDGRVLSYPGRAGLAAVVVDLAPRPGYAGALATLSAAPPQVREYDAGPLLDG